jgi:hypothetical protein
MAEADWFYSIAGRRMGPLSLAELSRAIASFPNAANVLVWRSGLPSWTAAGSVPELAVLLPPPVPIHQSQAVSLSPPALLGRLSPKFALYATLLATALLAAVLLAKSAGGTYDASGRGVLASQYTKVTRGSSVSYRVTYAFIARGRQYSGTDTIYHLPSARETTVYYMEGDPRDNGLSRNRLNDDRLMWAGLAFLLAIVGYWRLPTADSTQPAHRSRVGDSGGEHLRMERGKYDAWVHIGVAFFGQLGVVGVSLALLLSLLPGASATSDVVLVIATLGAVASTLWVYSDRWLCIEAYSSKYCSGCANLSIAYVPLVALVYANYRAFRRLQGQ